MIYLKLFLQIETIKRLKKTAIHHKGIIKEQINKMQINIENLNKIELESKIFRNSLMGLEGTNARMYYKSLNIF
ncbi:MAG: CRISPR-associated endonuclease Cas1, partial [Polaribacter sp.]